MPEQMTEEDLDYIYVLIPNEHSEERDLLTIRQCTDQQFRWWISGMAEYHRVQILPPLGRIGMETRLAMINRLIRHGVKIYKAPRDPSGPAVR